jgi:WD40 repeat protein
VNALAVFPDGRRIVSACEDGTARVWPISHDEEPLVLCAHSQALTAVAVSACGRWLFTSSLDRTVKMWDVQSAKEVDHTEHQEPVEAIVVPPDGLGLLFAGGDGTVGLWDPAGDGSWVIQGHDLGLTAIAITPDGKGIVSASWDRTLRVWHGSGHQQPAKVSPHAPSARGVAVDPHGRWAVSGCDGSVVALWNLVDSQLAWSKREHSESISAVAIDSACRFAVTGSNDATLRLWDLKSAATTRVFSGHRLGVSAVVIPPDSEIVVSASLDSTIRVWRVRAPDGGVVLGHHHGFPVASVDAAGDGRRVVSAAGDGTVRLWDINTRREVSRLEHPQRVNVVRISRDGKIAVSGCRGGFLAVWDLERGEILHMLETGDPEQSAEPATIASLAASRSEAEWRADFARRASSPFSGTVTALTLLPDDTHCVSGHEGGELIHWDLTTGGKVRSLPGHSGEVTSVEALPGGKLVSTGQDGIIHVWALDTGCLEASFEGDGAILACAFGGDPPTIVAAEATGSVHLLHLKTLSRQRRQAND